MNPCTSYTDFFFKKKRGLAIVFAEDTANTALHSPVTRKFPRTACGTRSEDISSADEWEKLCPKYNKFLSESDD